MRFAFQIQSNSRMQIIICSLYRSRVLHENTKYIRFVRAVLHNRITHPQPYPLLCAVGAWWRPGHTNLWGETFEIRLWTENQDYLLSRSLTVCTPGGLLGQIWLVVWTREKKNQGKQTIECICHPDVFVTWQTFRLSLPSVVIDPILFECWASVYGAGPTFKQHRLNVSCLLGQCYGIGHDSKSIFIAVIVN